MSKDKNQKNADASEAKTGKARVLIDGPIGGIPYKCNNVIEADVNLIKSHSEYLDDSEGAVKYCVEELGAKVIKHGAPKAEKPAED